MPGCESLHNRLVRLFLPLPSAGEGRGEGLLDTKHSSSFGAGLPTPPTHTDRRSLRFESVRCINKTYGQTRCGVRRPAHNSENTVLGTFSGTFPPARIRQRRKSLSFIAIPRRRVDACRRKSFALVVSHGERCPWKVENVPPCPCRDIGHRHACRVQSTQY
jgi:hypothetical protein